MPAREPAARSIASGFFVVALAAAAIAIGCGSAVDNRPATFSYIWPAIIQPSCATASCHSAIAARAGVVLEDKNTAYETLTTRNFVIPGDAQVSELPQLLRATAVRRMPPDFPLAPANIQLIEAWIDMGAQNN